MDKKYYINNVGWGVFFLCVFLWQSNIWLESNITLAWVILTTSTLLYPFSKRLIERIALLCTTKKFWHKGFFSEDIGKNGLYAIYYTFCFIFSIPLGTLYIILLSVKKSPITR